MIPSIRPFVAAVVAMIAGPSFAHAEPRTFSSAETPATLLELYSSEGCSSCPPAEDWIGQLKTNPGLWTTIVPVVFHVDYWDGLGWPDRFASREFTARQRRYAATWQTNSVYTPGFVAAGREWKGFFQRGNLPAPSTEKVGKLSVTLPDPTRAEITFVSDQPAPKTLQAWVALLGGDLATDVQRGENRGRKLRHDFVALHLQSTPLTFADHRWTATLKLPTNTKDTPVAIAAWIAVGEVQPPLQATGGWLR